MVTPVDVPNRGIEERKTVGETPSASGEARLRALDAMLGGVAHDLNNALSVVLMNLDVMQQDPAFAAKHGRRIDGMLNAMTKASSLVRHLLNFSHSRRPEPEVVSLAEALEPLVELLQVVVGREIDIAIEAADEVGPCCVVVDAATFEVAVVRAALQLAAIMSGGGALIFRLGKSEPPADHVVLSLEAQPHDAALCSAAAGALDLALIEQFAREAQGHMTSTATDGELRGIALHLPACSETTTV
jgi:hypothetical protein